MPRNAMRLAALGAARKAENLLRMGGPSEKKVAKKLASTCVDCMSKGRLSVKMHVKRQLFANIEWRGLHKHAKRKATCCHIDFVT